MNESIWYHHPIIIAPTLIGCAILIGIASIIAVLIESWLPIVIVIVVSLCLITRLLIWLRGKSLTITSKGRLLVNEPFRFNSKSYNPFISTIEYSQGFLGRVLDYGDVIVCFPEGDLEFLSMDRFSDLKSALENEQQRTITQVHPTPIVNIFMSPPYRVNQPFNIPFRIHSNQDPLVVDAQFVDEENELVE